jgi:hypothetical protein
MMSVDQHVEQAIPHEAGHILVGRILGVPVWGLDHIVVCGDKEFFPGDFATKSVSPDPLVVPCTPRNILEAYVCMIGGGLAGNVVSKVVPDQSGLKKDRADLSVVSAVTLEEASQKARPIIERSLAVFDKLIMAIRDRFDNLASDPHVAAGRYTLLTNDQLEEICPQNKYLFPTASYR